MCTCSVRLKTSVAAGPNAASSRRPLATRSCQRVGDRARLLVDFLEHEVAVLALLGGVRGQLALAHRALDRVAVLVEDLDGRAADVGDVAFFEEHEAARHRQQRRDVGGDEVLVDAQADDHRAAFARQDDALRARASLTTASA